MSNRQEQTVRFGCGDTVVSLIGERDGLYLRRSVLITNEFSIPLEVDLSLVGYVTPIRNPKELRNALNMVIGYWNKDGLIDGRVKRDVRLFIRNNDKMAEDIQQGIDAFNHLNTRSYELISGLRIKDDRVIITVPSQLGHSIRYTIIVKGKRYQTNLTVTDGPRTKNCIRHKKLMNCNSLIKQSQDWLDVNSGTPSDSVGFENNESVRHFLVENKTAITELINTLNAS